MNRRQFLSLPAAAALARAADPPRLRRADSFFGLHFDLHPDKSDTELGRDVTDEMVADLLDRTRPDFVQYDCKGHPGWLGYPSEVSPSARMARDSLAVWRRQTAKRGIALYVHFSGVWDSLAVEQHPEWARVGPDGKPDREQTSTVGPYVDRRMIPQLREAATKYDLDGAWVDGECWATKPDYSEAAARLWGRALPKSASDKGWLAFLEFNREQFRRYVAHYVDALHSSHPRLQLASNWLYTTYVPERPSLPVDFLSGDYLGNAAISAARLDARYLAAVGKPWDLMAWGFQWGRYNPIGNIHKPAVQLQQEAAVVLAQGGAFQVYYHPPRRGRIDSRLIDVMAEVAEFCRARQKLCHKSASIPQVGVLFSKHALYSSGTRLFGGWGKAVDPARGLLDALLECHYSVDVIPDWKLADVAAQYPLIAVPDWNNIGQEAVSALRRYAEHGGRLLVVGAENAAALGLTAAPAREQEAWIAGHRLLGNVKGKWLDVGAGSGEVVASRYPTFDTASGGKPAAILTTIGQGRVIFIPGPIGAASAATHDPATREFLGAVVDRLWTPDVHIDGPPSVEVALRRQGDTTVLHLANAAGMQVAGDYAVIDHVPSLGPIPIELKLPRAPRSVTIEPSGEPLAGEYARGRWTGTLPSLAIHAIIAVRS